MAIRGIEKHQEISRAQILRDTRPLARRVLTTLASFQCMVVVYTALMGLLFVAPALFELVLLVGVTYFFIPLTRKPDIPFRIRQSLHEIDHNDLHPGTHKPQKSRGIAFIGNRRSDNAEVWGANGDLRTHLFVLGSTGAGKTEGLLSLAYNALVWGSGFTYVDGKADVSLFAKTFSMARKLGREDDLLVINFMTGNADTTKARPDKLTNSYNPYAVGNAESLIQLTVSLMDASDGKNDMWKGRAIAFISAVIPPLVDLRDQGRLLLHVGAIREYLPFPKFWQLMNDPHISKRSRDMMLAFLYDVPGFRLEKAENQSSTFFEQYGYQQMQFTRILSSLADTYGHIFHTPQGEVVLKDVVLQRRILLVLLPALEKSGPERANLGKIIMAGKKGMMGANLGNRVEGDKRHLLDARATNSPTPYPVIFDELGYYMVEDAAAMWAQARSLGFSLIAAGQDLQAFYRTSKEETLAIVSNSNIKIVGKLEDPTDTWDLVEKLAAEAYVSVVDGYEQDLNSIAGAYRSGLGARFERVRRVEIQDLQEQIEGEVHIFMRGQIIRARMFYANPPLAKEYRLNHFIQVIPPDDDSLRALRLNASELLRNLILQPFSEYSTDDNTFAYVAGVRDLPVFKQYEEGKQGAERGICLLVHFDPEYHRSKESSFAENGETGGGGGYVNDLRLEPDAEGGANVPEATAVTPQEEPASPADADSLNQVQAQSEDARADVVLDGGKLESVSIFECRTKTELDVASVVLAAAPVIEAVLGVKVESSRDIDRGTVSGSGGILNDAETEAALNAVALGLGASPDEALQAARALIRAATNGTEYPVPPKPVRDGKEEEMEEVLSSLQSLVDGQ